MLLLVGVGVLQEKIKQKVKMLGMAKKVLFMDFRDDVSNLMQAMDVYLFPSKWEGLPLVLIEAQASGLQCFVSNTISIEISMTEYICMMDLNCSASFWAQEIIKNINVRYDTDNDIAIKQIEAYGYNIKKEAQCLKKIWLGNLK